MADHEDRLRRIQQLVEETKERARAMTDEEWEQQVPTLIREPAILEAFQRVFSLGRG